VSALTAAALHQRLHEAGVHTLLVQFTDLHGVAKGKLVPVQHLDEVLRTGVGFAGPSIWGTGLARTGATIGHGSGDFVVAFSTTRRIRHEVGGPGIVATPLIADEARMMEALFPAVVEAVEEAVLNSLCAAETVVGRDEHVRYALPLAEVAELLGQPRIR